MAILTILPFGKAIEMDTDENVLQALRRAGYNIEGPCNGKGICGKCRIQVENADELPETPHRLITAADMQKGVRLACRMEPDADMAVQLPQDFAFDARILEGERLADVDLHPAVKVVQQQGVYHFIYNGTDSGMLADWHVGDTPRGLAIDIGTTTIVITLFDLDSGEELATASAINPQTRFGHDVLTRIQHATTDGGLDELAGVVRDELNNLIDKTCRASDSRAEQILDVVIGGNTTMLQLVAAIDPEPLGHVPFRVDIQGGQTYPVAQFGLNVHAAALVYVPPIIHAYIGTDITAGFLASGFLTEKDPTLFIDIGTNGEMGLISSGQVMASSTAAGPAFEGMGVANGMRAAAGAIEKASVNGDTFEISTIDDQPAKGICGSGIIDVMACMVKMNVVDSSGRMKMPSQGGEIHPPSAAAHLQTLDEKPAFRIAEGIYFTQNDVRQMQLAKGAIRTGVEMLIEEAGLVADDVKKVVLAGAFGYHLRPESLETIGLLPPNFSDRVLFAGNTSKTGAALMLLNADLRAYLKDEVRKVQHVALAEKPSFQNMFISHLTFPER